MDGWQATYEVGRRAIEEYMNGAGPDLANRQAAICELRVKFNDRFPTPGDPALIRNYIDSIEANLRLEADDASQAP